MSTETATKSTKTPKPKLHREDYGHLAEYLAQHIEEVKKATAGKPFTDQDIVKLGRLLALKNKCAAINAIEPKKWTKKTK